VLTGTAAGLAEALGIEPLLVRLSFAVLTVAGGTGIVLYLVLWVLSAEPDTITLNPAIRERPRTRQIAAVACIVAGCMLVGRSTGLTFGAAFAWPVAWRRRESALIWARATRATGSAGLVSASACRQPGGERLRGQDLTAPGGRGGLLIAAGMTLFLVVNGTLASARTAVLAVLVTRWGWA